jgi:hypothetical protein
MKRIGNFSKNFRDGFFVALYEYLIITMPVGIYVSLEALHKNNWGFFFNSPEWSIATIFLSFISVSRYRKAIEKGGFKLSDPVFGIIGIIGLSIVVCSTLNAYVSIKEESSSAVIFRGILFVVASSKFFILLIGTKLLQKPN